MIQFLYSLPPQQQSYNHVPLFVFVICTTASAVHMQEIERHLRIHSAIITIAAILVKCRNLLTCSRNKRKYDDYTAKTMFLAIFFTKRPFPSLIVCRGIALLTLPSSSGHSARPGSSISEKSWKSIHVLGISSSSAIRRLCRIEAPSNIAKDVLHSLLIFSDNVANRS